MQLVFQACYQLPECSNNRSKAEGMHHIGQGCANNSLACVEPLWCFAILLMFDVLHCSRARLTTRKFRKIDHTFVEYEEQVADSSSAATNMSSARSSLPLRPRSANRLIGDSNASFGQSPPQWMTLPVAGRDPIAMIRESLCTRDSLWS